MLWIRLDYLHYFLSFLVKETCVFLFYFLSSLGRSLLVFVFVSPSNVFGFTDLPYCLCFPVHFLLFVSFSFFHLFWFHLLLSPIPYDGSWGHRQRLGRKACEDLARLFLSVNLLVLNGYDTAVEETKQRRGAWSRGIQWNLSATSGARAKK